MKISAASYGVSSMLPGEHSDCTVRALANVEVMLYPEAHELMRSYGRQQGAGLSMDKVHEAYTEAGLELVGTFGKSSLAIWCNTWFNNKKINKGCTLAKFVEQHQEGRYIVYIKGHVLALVDGDVIDTIKNSASARVLAAWKVPE